MHKPTISDDPLERRIYERAARDHEAFLVEPFKTILADFEPRSGGARRRVRDGAQGAAGPS